MIPSQIVGGNISPVVVDWVNRVQNNGGAKPSQNTISAVDHFYRGLDATTILGKVKSLCCYVPDNVIACITPLIKAYGYDPWLNNNNQFVSSDLTVNGLMGNGAGYSNQSVVKYLNTGVLGTNYSSNTAGLTVYAYTAGLQLGGDGGTYDAGYTNSAGSQAVAMSFLWHNSYQLAFFAYGESGNAAATYSYSPPPYYYGYLSGNLASGTNETLYFANSSYPHALVGSSTYTGAAAAYPIYVHAVNHTDASPPQITFGASTSRISFVAIHDGLTSNESSQFFNLIQTFRKRIGGGWV